MYSCAVTHTLPYSRILSYSGKTSLCLFSAVADLVASRIRYIVFFASVSLVVGGLDSGSASVRRRALSVVEG